MVFYLLALLSPLVFAFGTVLQQRGTLETRAHAKDPRFFLQMLRRPSWLFGVLGLVVAWGLQAAALRLGGLVIVQALQVLSLVFALPIGVRLSRQRVTWASGGAAMLTVAGLVAFVTLGHPKGGISTPGATAWLAAGPTVAVLTVALSWFGWKYHGRVAAALFGIGSGLCFGLEAAVTKLIVAEIGRGIAPLLIHWPLYVFVITGVAGFALQQAALKTGALAPALAAIHSATLAGSVFLGLAVFKEALSQSTPRLVPAVVGLALAFAGVVLLSVYEATPIVTGGGRPWRR
jgi:hypothetical protein